MKNKPGIGIRKYLDEALGLGLFMVSACFFGALLEYHGLPFSRAIPFDLLRRFIVGLAMGLTALYIFTSGFGKQSGAYINPAVTLIRCRLGNIEPKDALFYSLFQLIGGSIGVYLVYWCFPLWMRSPEVNYAITVPGKQGIAVAFLLEYLISLLLISVVLFMGLKEKWDRYSPHVVSLLICLYITFEAPFSGMSMNPARTFASAVVAGQWNAFWLYCTAPVLGMLSGELLYRKTKHYLL